MSQDLHRKVDELLQALQKGLSGYAGPLRVAVMVGREGDMRVYDPYQLLRAHAGHLQQPLQLPPIEGLVAFALQTPELDQVWYAEHSAEVCHPDSIRLWLRGAARCLADEVALGFRSEVQFSKITLENYSLYALESFIHELYQRHRGRPPEHRVMEILEAMAALSLATEEAAPTSGEILFVDRATLEDQPMQLAFSPRPRMLNKKHLSKLFHGLWSGVSLLSCGQEVWGVARREEMQVDLLLRATFHSGIGGLFLGGSLLSEDQELCTVSAGRYLARRIRPELPGLKMALKRCGYTNAETRSLDHNLSILCSEISRRHFGATLVLETGTTPLVLSGQSVTPTRLDIQALRALSEVDGALHLDREGRLKGFACLLDGMASGREDRAHGARYNSAVRFTETHEDCVVIVISADGPISVFRKGARLGSSALLKPRPSADLDPPTLSDWLKT